MNKRILPIVALFMLAIGSGILAQAAVTTYFTPEENLMVLNLPKLGFWENERDDGGYYTIMDEEGNVLDKMSRVIYVGDELIAEDNNQYRVDRVVGDTAIAKIISKDVLAEYDELIQTVFQEPLVPAQTSKNLVALYHTHSAESYVPNEGTESIPGNGGIFKVGDSLTQGLEKKGVNVKHSRTPHEPRDANAYQRSRRTALQLLKTGPSTIIDVHRDGVPDPDFYNKEIAGNNATSIRLVVGRQNQNMQANLDFAKTVKAGMNKYYPGLIKSIFMAKGNYNQDLSPRSMLIEVGTHTNDRTRAETGAKLFGDALPTILGIVTPTTKAPAKAIPATGGDWTALWWILGIFLIGGALFLLVSTGSIKGASDKLKQFTSSEWANFLGKEPQKNKKNNKKNDPSES